MPIPYAACQYNTYWVHGGCSILVLELLSLCVVALVSRLVFFCPSETAARSAWYSVWLVVMAADSVSLTLFKLV